MQLSSMAGSRETAEREARGRPWSSPAGQAGRDGAAAPAVPTVANAKTIIADAATTTSLPYRRRCRQPRQINCIPRPLLTMAPAFFNRSPLEPALAAMAAPPPGAPAIAAMDTGDILAAAASRSAG